MVSTVGLRRTRARLLGLLVALPLVLLGIPPVPAHADYVTVCTGYADCREAGYSNFGYQGAKDTSWWRMYTGHNCTNYVAYRMVQAGLPNDRPWSGGGNAENWGHAMSGITDDTPMVGSVAWWAKNVRPAGSSGHVAYVERVVSNSEIWISEDSWGGDFHWRKVTKSGSGWPSGFIHFKDVTLRGRTAPGVTGTAEVGQTLAATPGTWTPEASSYTYQWLADGKPVTGATAATFALGPRKLEQQMSVQVTATGRGYAPAVATSAATAAVGPGELEPDVKPVVTGEALVGAVLSASRGVWTPAPKARRVQWLSGGKPIEGATGWTLELGPDQAGAEVTAVVTAARKGYEPSTVASVPTESVLGGSVSVTAPFELDGVPRLGEELRVIDGAYDPASAVVAYTWLRDGAEIAGASGRSYVLRATDVGRRVSVRVDVSKAGYKPATQTTGESTPVRTVPQVRARAKGGRLRAQVSVTVVAPGVTPPLGRISVRIGTNTRTVVLREGQRSVVLKGLRAGERPVVVRYPGRGLVDPGVFRGTVTILPV